MRGERENKSRREWGAGWLREELQTKWPRASQRPRRSLAKVAELCKDQKLGEQREKLRLRLGEV